MSEEWRPVVGFDGLYEVSSGGRFRNASGRPMACQLLRSGYLTITLCRFGISKTFRAHSLVLTAFIGPRPDGMQTRHLNGVRNDNRLVNLCWGTAAENNADKVRHGTAYSFYAGKRFEDHPNAKLSKSTARILVYATKYFLPRDLAQLAGVSTATVQRLVRDNAEWRPTKTFSDNQRDMTKVMQQASARKEREMGRQSP